MSGAAKAWVNFNGTGTVAIRASFNVTSITDNGTGDYTVNFTNALEDANYSAVGVAIQNATGNWGNFCSMPYSQVPTVSSVRAYTGNYGGLAVDTAYVQIAIFR